MKFHLIELLKIYKLKIIIKNQNFLTEAMKDNFFKLNYK